MSDFDLSQRFKFLGLDEQDRHRLRKMKDTVKAALPSVMDDFYLEISRNREVDEMFLNEDMRRHAREKQIDHWLRIADAKFDGDYLDSVARIGEAHARLGLKPQWYFGGYAKIVQGLQSAIVDDALKSNSLFSGGNTRAELEANLNTVTKAAMLDMDLAISRIEECVKREAIEEQNRLADAFEATVTAIVNSVAAASEELGQTARAMSGTADQTQEKSSSVAAAAEEATATAQSVAGAAHQRHCGDFRARGGRRPILRRGERASAQHRRDHGQAA